MQANSIVRGAREREREGEGERGRERRERGKTNRKRRSCRRRLLLLFWHGTSVPQRVDR